MTENVFKNAMMCGLGRCIIELDAVDNVEKYRQAVLYGCRHNITYDVQCEGVKGWYMYQLIKRFDDKKEFLTALFTGLNKSIKKHNWSFEHYCGILSWFVSDGYSFVEKKLWELYEKIYSELLCSISLDCDMAENFEGLCIELIDSADKPSKAYLRIATDIGRLYAEGKAFKAFTFNWLFACCDKYVNIINKNAVSVPYVKAYLKKNETESKRINSRICEKDRIYTAAEIYTNIEGMPIYIGRQLYNNERYDEIKALAKIYSSERDIKKRTKLLRILGFGGCADYLPVSELIKDALSDNVELSDNAFLAFERIHSDEARQFAYKLIDEGKYTEQAFYIIANNYCSEDKDFICSFVKAAPVKYNDDYKHGIFMAVIDIFKQKGVKNPPKELLYYMYERSWCSYCRKRIITEMGRRRLLTEDILKECLFDSNEDIRNYARKRLKV